MASNIRNGNGNRNEDAIEFTLNDILKYIPSELRRSSFFSFGGRNLNKLYRLLPKNTNNDYSVFSSDEEEGIFDLANILRGLVYYALNTNKFNIDTTNLKKYLDIICLIYSRLLHHSEKFNIYKNYIFVNIKAFLLEFYIDTLIVYYGHKFLYKDQKESLLITLHRIEFIFTYLIDNINFDTINTGDINKYRYSRDEIPSEIMPKVMELETFLIDYKSKRRGLILKHQKNTCYYNKYTVCHCNRCTRKNNRANSNRANSNRATCNNCKRNAGGVCPKHR